MSLPSLWVFVRSAADCCLQHCSCLRALLLALGWPLIWVPLPATLLFLRGLHFPCWDHSPKSLVYSGWWLHSFVPTFPYLARLQSPAVPQLCFYLLLSCFASVQLSRGQSCASQSWAWLQAADLEPWLGRKQRGQGSCSSGPALPWQQPGWWHCRDPLFHRASLILTLNTQLRNNGRC